MQFVTNGYGFPVRPYWWAEVRSRCAERSWGRYPSYPPPEGERDALIAEYKGRLPAFRGHVRMDMIGYRVADLRASPWLKTLDPALIREHTAGGIMKMKPASIRRLTLAIAAAGHDPLEAYVTLCAGWSSETKSNELHCGLVDGCTEDDRDTLTDALHMCYDPELLAVGIDDKDFPLLLVLGPRERRLINERAFGGNSAPAAPKAA